MLGFEGFFTSGEKIRRNEEDLLKRFDEAPEAVRTDGPLSDAIEFVRELHEA